jgi:hypothetical protein
VYNTALGGVAEAGKARRRKTIKPFIASGREDDRLWQCAPKARITSGGRSP